MINFITEDIHYSLFTIHSQSKIERWIRAVAAGYGFAVGDITYIFCSDERILEVNRQHLYLPGYGCVQCAGVRNSV